ncbi:ABC transporter permease [Rhizobium alvei]|uniref:ABC transporter permease n=1 Tax=Rhizobium alvei TaxID=1132659 RepID=A0ABT8YRK9_9HYPH|nr:ABC transporter permease [Rhizobium alvei]MDO6966360.1 ABC transporter permease [Rhizobium alvei]
MNRYLVVDLFLDIVKSLWVAGLLVAIWLWLSAGSTSFYFPPLADILSVLWNELVHGPLGTHLAASLSNLAYGLLIACVCGVVFGLVIGRSQQGRKVLSPILNFLRAVPPAAIVPIVIIALGVGSAPKIFIIALGCFWPILLNTIDGVRGTSPSLLETVRAYRIPPHLALVRVALPAALPQIMAGIRVALAVGLVLMVISEFFGADQGIGFYITDASTRFAIRETWAGTLLVGILGYILSFAFLLIERRLLRWYFQDDGTSIWARLRAARLRTGGGA